MRPSAQINIYFESLTLMNVGVALLGSIRGHQIYYFALGRVFRKFPILSSLLLSRFHEVDIWLSEFPGLSFRIHQTALDGAEHHYKQITRQNPKFVSSWSKAFRSQKVNLYIKKKLATESWNLIRIYLILCSRVNSGHFPLRLVVLDNSMNQVVVPWLFGLHPEPRIRVSGLNRPLWRWLQGSLEIVMSTASVFASLLRLIRNGGLRLRSSVHRYKIGKEIIWGIGTGQSRRQDDFMVDGRLILTEDILFYHRRGTAPRLASPEMLPASIANAMAEGYKVIAFDRTPIPLVMLWKVIVPRYIIFPLVICLLSLVRQIALPSTGYLNRTIMSFLRQSLGWEVFLSSYSLAVNLSQDEADASHIADTVALNLHGSQNAGFQWADMTQWRAVTLAYVGYNVYFAWGALPEKYWEGSWDVDQVVHIGYLWGHHYQESLSQRAEQRKLLLGDGSERGFVVALLDEKPNPNLYTSDKMLYDFYRVGVDLLERRPDTVVIAKPKRLDGIRDKPEVLELIAPYVESGRFQVWDRQTVDVQQVMAMSDVVVSMVMGSPYLEAACCGRTGFNYAPIGNETSRIYREGLGRIIFDDVDALVGAIEWSLDHPSYDPWTGLEELRNDVDPYRDMKGIERFRRAILDASGPDSSDDHSDFILHEDAEEVT